MRIAATFVLNAIAVSAYLVSVIAAFAIFAYGHYLAITELLDGEILRAIIYSFASTLLAGLTQSVIALVGTPAALLSEKLGSRAW